MHHRRAVVSLVYQKLCVMHRVILLYLRPHNRLSVYVRRVYNRLNASLDLESFSCPKAEHLFDDLVWLETYGTKCIPTLCQGRGRSLWTLVGESEGLNHPKKKKTEKNKKDK